MRVTSVRRYSCEMWISAKNFLPLVPLIAALPVAVSISTLQETAKPDEAPLRAIVQTLEDGWNAGDSSKFASPFATDADYVVVNGQHIRTRAIIDFGQSRHLARYTKAAKIRAP